MQSTFLNGISKEYLCILFFKTSFLDIFLWQWSALFLFIFLAYIASWYTARLFIFTSYQITIKQFPNFDKTILSVFFSPIHIGFLLAYFALGVKLIHLPPDIQEFFNLAGKLLFVFDLTWLSFRIIDAFGVSIEEGLLKKNKVSIITMLPLIRRTFKTSIVILAILTALQNLGFEVTALLTGLGIGGIAIALAAQKTLENLLGGAMLVLDQPIRIGDTCRFGTWQGTVEEIGLRSTKIRTLERTLISVPNSDLAQREIENFDVRDRIRFHSILGLRYETTPEQLRDVLSQIHQLLIGHPKVDKDPARVRFIRLGSYSLDIEIHAYILTKENDEFLSIREGLLLSIMDIVKQCNTSLAFPSQTTYLSSDCTPNSLPIKNKMES